MNKVLDEDRSIHDWYRFVLSYPPHLVRDYLTKFGVQSGVVLDPFCGTGTTLVECKKLGIASEGIEANPMAWFASSMKTDWGIEPTALLGAAEEIAQRAEKHIEQGGMHDDPDFFRSQFGGNHSALLGLTAPQEALILKNSISPIPLHKTLRLLQCIDKTRGTREHGHLRLALAKALVVSIGNLHFGPEVGVGKPKQDARVIAAWLDEVRTIARDIATHVAADSTSATIHHADSREAARHLKPASINAVITSPPYPNEKDYTRTTRLESVILGFISTKAELKALKQGLVRSNTRNVYVADRDHELVEKNTEVQRIAAEIEARRIAMGKTSGFERLYHKVTKLYFGGMARHFAELRHVLAPGAHLAYVVGDQASYLRVMIRTGNILADIARELGYTVEGIDLFRTRLATATREQLREEVVILRWNGRT